MAFPRINPQYRLNAQHYVATRGVAAPAPAPVPAPAAASSAGRYTLEMDPEVVAALSYEKQGLADIASTPMPGAPSTGQYDVQMRHLQEMRPIQLEELGHQYGIAQRNITNSLAARNMLRSGETGYLQGEATRSYNLGVQGVDRNVRWQQEAIDAA